MEKNSDTWEIAASIYPVDIHDEGIERILDNLQRESLVNSTYLVGLTHPERRPTTRNSEYAHNPVRKTFMAEDSRVYWTPQMGRYGRIRPQSSDHTFLRETDWLQLIVEEARKRNLRPGLEISHTVVGAERALAEFPDCVQKDLYGRPLDGLHVVGARPMCPNNPDASEYIVNLFADVVEHYDIDYIQTCLIPYPMPVPFLLQEYDASLIPHREYPGFGSIRNHQWPRLVARHAGCFCDSCRVAAESRGLDFERMQHALREMVESDARASKSDTGRAFVDESNTSESAILLETPELLQWLQFRCDSITALYRRIHDTVHAIKPNIELRLNLYVTTHPEYAGINLSQLTCYLDGVRTSNYAESLGHVGYLAHKREFLNGVQRTIHGRIPLYSGTSVKEGATRETIIEGIRIAHECGAAGITLGHYDCATLERLSAVGEGVRIVRAAV